MNIAASKEDVQVFIGNKPCNVTNLLVDQIYCAPPTHQPPAISETGNTIDGGNPKVIVSDLFTVLFLEGV